MKIMTLNTWGGRLYEPQVEFLKRHKLNTDIFCFQEVYNGESKISNVKGAVTDMFSEYQNILSDFQGIHSESRKNDFEGTQVSYGISIFYKNNMLINDIGTFEIFKQDEKVDIEQGLVLWNRLLQYITIPYNNSTLTVFNLHGLYTGGDKEDGSARLLQSQRVKSFMNDFSGEKILCGDFNLNPETKSFHILSDGMRDLIQENGITSTRSHYYPKERKFADYMLLSPGIKIKKFEVLKDVVSDHLPLVLEF
jgi:endonuclease/exonuclease/phosphatase family metal-dependent hydrolase